MSDKMSDAEVRAELERIDRVRPVGKDDKTLCELLEEANDTWIPGSNAIEMFRLLAESQQALGEIIPRAAMASEMTLKDDLDGVRANLLGIEKIARKARGGKRDG